MNTFKTINAQHYLDLFYHNINHVSFSWGLPFLYAFLKPQNEGALVKCSDFPTLLINSMFSAVFLLLFELFSNSRINREKIDKRKTEYLNDIKRTIF